MMAICRWSLIVVWGGEVELMFGGGCQELR